MAATDTAPSQVKGHSPVNWDGKQHAYRPSSDWLSRVSPSLELHTEAEENIDPVTYEVIRNRLWTSNLAHGETLVRISGSPIFQALDFNMCILTEDAEMVSNAPFITYLVMGAPLAIPYIMENFSEAPGIEEGDVFLVNDPWIGASHQMDVLFAAPVFIDEKLFAWVSNAGHQYDLGGIVPGGWPQNAPDIFHDPVVFSPFKIVEKGVLRKDLEEMYRRQSRMPNLVALDLRALLGGLNYAVKEVTAICKQFGPRTVKGAMRRVLDTAQKSFEGKLARIPDGTWSEVRYVDEKMPGDRGTYRVQVNVEKRGTRLIIDNKGTDPQQDGPIGFNFVSFSGAVLGTLSVTMLYEQLFAVGGAARQIDYEVEPGLLSCVDFPAPVSGGIFSIINCINALMLIVSRMLACDPELRDDIVGAQAEWPLLVLAGENDRGEMIGTALMEPVAEGSGGKPTRDGVDTNGMVWTPLMRLLNIESVEQTFPLVYLYRRERKDGGGVGRYRGGTGMDFAVTPYRAKSIAAITNVGGAGVSTHGCMGLFGGYPTPTCSHLIRKGTNLADLFSARQLPRDVRELEADEEILLRGKSNGTPLEANDVLEGSFAGGGGYGDPLEREPEFVERDLRLGYTTVETALECNGVVVDERLCVDLVKTEQLRVELLKQRQSWKPAAEVVGAVPDNERTPATGEPSRPVHEYVIARDSDRQRVLACSRCDSVLADYRGNYKTGMLMDEGPVTGIPGVQDPSRYVDDQFVFRRFCCPGCFVMAATELVRAGEPLVSEMAFASA